MSEHRSLTDRQREVIAAVVSTGSIKGSVVETGISETSVHHRVAYARQRCGCGSILELVYRHRHEIEHLVNLAP